MNPFYCLLLLILLLQKINAQEFNYFNKHTVIKNIVATSSKYYYRRPETKFENNIFTTTIYYQDSFRLENLKEYSLDSENTIIACLDTNGVILSYDKLEGTFINSPLSVKQGEYLFTSNTTRAFKFNDQIINPIVCNHKVYTRIFHRRNNNTIQCLDTFFLETYPEILHYDSLTHLFVIYFRGNENLDTNHVITKEYFRPEKHTLIIIDASGRIIQHAFFDNTFSKIAYSNNTVYLSRSIDSIDKGDQRKFSVLHCFNLTEKRLIWKELFAGEILELNANQNGILLSLFEFKSSTIKSLKHADYPQYNLLYLNLDGKKHWNRHIDSKEVILTRLKLNANDIDLILFKPRHTPIATVQNPTLTESNLTYGTNRVILSLRGDLEYHYPIEFAYPSEVILSTRNNTHFQLFQLKDTLTLNHKKFATIKLNHREHYIFYKSENMRWPKNKSIKYIPPVTIYPNPTNTSFKINGIITPRTVKIKIYDLTGLLKLSLDQDVRSPINVQMLEQGIYLINIEVGGKMYSFKLIKS